MKPHTLLRIEYIIDIIGKKRATQN